MALIVILIDGLGADYFENNRQHLPHLDALAKSGTQVKRLSVDQCAISMSGRTSIITGHNAAAHGVSTNDVWDGYKFRPANSDDVRMPNVAGQAKRSGLDVANIGFGMIGEDDCDIFYAPYWSHEMLMKTTKINPANSVWLKEIASRKGFNRIEKLRKRGFADDLPERLPFSDANYLSLGQRCDGILLNWSAGLATEEIPPDLIFTEITSTDYFLHRYGCTSSETLEAMKLADSQVGELLSCLYDNGADESYNIAVMSDHGFTDINESLHPKVMFPNHELSVHGGNLQIRHKGVEDLAHITRTLEAQGAIVIDNEYLPKEQRAIIATFLAPQNCNFHADYFKTGKPRGKSKYKATHGFAKGYNKDERFCLFSGPDVTNKVINKAKAGQIAPTLAKLSGLDTTPYPLKRIF